MQLFVEGSSVSTMQLFTTKVWQKGLGLCFGSCFYLITPARVNAVGMFPIRDVAVHNPVLLFTYRSFLGEHRFF